MSLIMDKKRVLVFGGNGGIGRAVVDMLAKSGYEVFMTYRQESELNSSKYYTSLGIKCIHLNLLDYEELMKMELPTVEAIIFAAGSSSKDCMFNVGRSELEDQMNLQVYHPLYLIQRYLKNDSLENIIFISSIAWREVNRSGGVYAFSKANVITLVNALAAELLPRSISVNAIAPGWVDTKMAKSVIEQSESDLEKEKEKKIDNEFVAPEEVAEWCLTLLKAKRNRVTGQVIEVNSFDKRDRK